MLRYLSASDKAKKAPAAAASDRAYDMMLDGMMPHQRALDQSRSKRDGVISPRQIGKSRAALMLAYRACLKKSKARWVIMGQTFDSLREIYMDAHDAINAMYGLGILHQKQNNRMVFPNDSSVSFLGYDKPDSFEKLRGRALDGVIVDEAQGPDHVTFGDSIQDVVEKALAVKRGRLILFGTPGDVLDGEFFLATTSDPPVMGNGRRSNYPIEDQDAVLAAGSPPLWCRHVWTPQANISMPHLWTDGLALKEARGWDDDHPSWRREYLGQWVEESGTQVYTFRSWKNQYDELPPGVSLSRGCGVDLGDHDGSAIVVWGYSLDHPAMYELYSEKITGTAEDPINADRFAQWYNGVEAEYGPFDFAVVDQGGLAGMFISTLADDYAIDLEPAQKRDKCDHIKLMNGDFSAGRIFLKRGSPLAQEMPGNKWKRDPRTGGLPPIRSRREDPSVPNDLCDAALYGFRDAANRRFSPTSVPEVDDLIKLRNQLVESLALSRRIRMLEDDPCLLLDQ